MRKRSYNDKFESMGIYGALIHLDHLRKQRIEKATNGRGVASFMFIDKELSALKEWFLARGIEKPLIHHSFLGAKENQVQPVVLEKASEPKEKLQMNLFKRMA